MADDPARSARRVCRRARLRARLGAGDRRRARLHGVADDGRARARRSRPASPTTACCCGRARARTVLVEAARVAYGPIDPAVFAVPAGLPARSPARTAVSDRARAAHAGAGLGALDRQERPAARAARRRVRAAAAARAAGSRSATTRACSAPRPLNALIHGAGYWAVWFLITSLVITPAKAILGLPNIVVVRRMIGNAALAYACDPPAAVLHRPELAHAARWSARSCCAST